MSSTKIVIAQTLSSNKIIIQQKATKEQNINKTICILSNH